MEAKEQAKQETDAGKKQAEDPESQDDNASRNSAEALQPAAKRVKQDSGDNSDNRSVGSEGSVKNGAADARSDGEEEERKGTTNPEQPPWDPANDGKTELFVQGLSFDTNDDDLRDHFSKYGTLNKCKLIYNKGKGFVEFETHEQAKAALAATNETELDGR